MSENVLIICPKIFFLKTFGYHYTGQQIIIIIIIKFTWLMAPKRKLNKISYFEEKSKGSSFSNSKKRNKKTEDVLTSIITVLIDMFGII